MGCISPDNTLSFAPTDELFDRVRRSLASFDAAGLIDAGTFFHYVVETLQEAGISYYQEQQAYMEIKDFKGPLPPNFYQLYAAFLCRHSHAHDISRPVLQDLEFWVTQKVEASPDQVGSCTIDYSRAGTQDSIKISTYFEDRTETACFRNMPLLRLSSHVKPIYFADGCRNLRPTCADEITLDNGVVYTNFSGCGIYMQYYGLPADSETGLPLIPKEKNIENAIEYYIRFRIIEELWLNNQAPDLEKRVQYLRDTYGLHLAKAKFYAKLPSFQTMVNHARQMRGRHDIFNRLTDSKATWYVSV